MSNSDAGWYAAIFGLVGVLAGSVAAAVTAISVAKIQLDQATITTRATSALSMRTTLAEKAAPFFLANEDFQESLEDKAATPEKVLAASQKVRTAVSQLYPYVDGDLLAACYGISTHLSRFVGNGDIDRKQALKEYWDSFKAFQMLYLRLRRDLERNAQVEVLSSQIDDKYIHNP